MEHDFLTSLNSSDSHTPHTFNSGDHHAVVDSHTFSFNHCLTTDDPLAHAHKIKVDPLYFEYVKPHWVDGYVRSDGTHVHRYLRDEDGYIRNK